MRVAIANFSPPFTGADDAAAFWSRFEKPPRPPRIALLEQEPAWGFHMESLGVYLLDQDLAREVEFWDFKPRRRAVYTATGVLRLDFVNDEDVIAYLDRFGYPDLFVNHGRHGYGILRHLSGRSFRVHVPALRTGLARTDNFGAECYLVDAEEFLDERSMLYVPVVNTRRFAPGAVPKERDFVYLAASYPGKRHDIVLSAVRGTSLTGHFHPVDSSRFDLSGTRITTSEWDEIDLVRLLQSSRMAVYPADRTSNPAAMWECVASGLPIVVNEAIRGGKHLIVAGITGEFATEQDFREKIEYVLARAGDYAPAEYFRERWDTIETIESYVDFFVRMGWRP